MYNSGGSYVYVPVIRGHYCNKHSSASHFEAFKEHFGYKRTHSSTLKAFKGHFGNKQAHWMNPNKGYHDLSTLRSV